VREHDESDHPEDRIHQSVPVAVRALRRQSLLPEDRPERTEIEVMMAAWMSDASRFWILMGEGEGPALLIIDEAGTHRLVEALRGLLPGK